MRTQTGCETNFINALLITSLASLSTKPFLTVSKTPILPVCLLSSYLAIFSNFPLTSEFIVNGSAIPDTDFDIGESYAGLLPVGGDSNGELYFWFFPTSDVDTPKEIIIWLNGGVSVLFKSNHVVIVDTRTARLLLPAGSIERKWPLSLADGDVQTYS